LGIWNSLASAYATEVVAGCGLDWMLLDTEHAPSDVPTALNAVAGGCRRSNRPRRPSGLERPAALIKDVTSILARAAVITHSVCSERRRGTCGGQGLPLSATRNSRRSSVVRRHNRFGRVPDYFERVHEELCIPAQAESLVALEHLDEDSRRRWC
jgi:4-hydroxy-2-oxoheptanedioate aldolase